MSWHMARLGKTLGFAGLGFGVVFLLLGSVLGVYMAVDGRRAPFRGLLDTGLALAHRTAAVETALGQLQHHAQAFLLRQDKQYRERFEATYATLRTDLDVLTGLAQRSGNTTLMDNVAAIAHYVATYADTFQQVVAAWDKRGLEPRVGPQGAFRKATHALATTLVHADVDDLYHELLLLRHWEQEVARTEQAPATQHLLATLARYQALLDQGPYAAHFKHAQQTALAGYAEALRPYLALTTPNPSKARPM